MKAKVPEENVDIWWFCLAFLKVIKLLSMCASFKSKNSIFLSTKNCDGDNFTPTPVSDYKVKLLWWK